MDDNLSRVTAQLGIVRTDLQLLSAKVTPDNQFGRHLIDQLRIASENVAGCIILAEQDLASPFLIVGRSIVESLFVTYWETCDKRNAEKILRRSLHETIRVMRSQINEGVVVPRRKTTGRDATDEVLVNPRIKHLDRSLNIGKIAKDCGLKTIYETAYRILSLPVHGNAEFILRNQPKVIRANLEVVRCTLKALHLIVGNYIRENCITGQDEILNLFVP